MGRADTGPPLVLTWLRSVRNTPLSVGAKALAGVLVTYANADGTSCWPGDDRLRAALAGKGGAPDDRTVRRWRAELMRAGLLVCTRRAAGPGRSGRGRPKPAEWQLVLPVYTGHRCPV